MFLLLEIFQRFWVLFRRLFLFLLFSGLNCFYFTLSLIWNECLNQYFEWKGFDELRWMNFYTMTSQLRSSDVDEVTNTQPEFLISKTAWRVEKFWVWTCDLKCRKVFSCSKSLNSSFFIIKREKRCFELNDFWVNGWNNLSTAIMK